MPEDGGVVAPPLLGLVDICPLRSQLSILSSSNLSSLLQDLEYSPNNSLQAYLDKYYTLEEPRAKELLIQILVTVSQIAYRGNANSNSIKENMTIKWRFSAHTVVRSLLADATSISELSMLCLP